MSGDADEGARRFAALVGHLLDDKLGPVVAELKELSFAMSHEVEATKRLTSATADLSKAVAELTADQLLLRHELKNTRAIVAAQGAQLTRIEDRVGGVEAAQGELVGAARVHDKQIRKIFAMLRTLGVTNGHGETPSAPHASRAPDDAATEGGDEPIDHEADTEPPPPGSTPPAA